MKSQLHLMIDLGVLTTLLILAKGIISWPTMATHAYMALTHA